MLLIVLISLIDATEPLEEYSRNISGNLQKMYSVFEKLYLPSLPLVYLSVEISLENLDPPLSEYPTPKPYAYARFDSVPTSTVFDYKVDLRSKSGSFQALYPPFSTLLIIRIDGGLQNSLHLFTAYSLQGWTYKIKLQAFYCPSGLFTVFPWNYTNGNMNLCTEKVENTKSLSQGLSPVMFFVPPSTSSLKIVSTASAYSLSPYNYVDSFITNDTYILNPLQGWWFAIVDLVSAQQTFVVTLEQCLSNNTVICNSQKVFFLSNLETWDQIPENPAPQVESSGYLFHIAVPIDEEALKYRYGITVYGDISSIQALSFGNRGLNTPVSLCNGQMYCKQEPEKLTAELEYAMLGLLYISLASNSTTTYQVSVFRTEIGDNMCNGQPYYDYNGITYFCYCLQNTAGFFCDSHAISDELYLTAVMFLTFSNLAMVPAIVYGFTEKAFVEITAYAANMIASYIYHWCDEQFYCFGISPYTLQVIDFILSYNSICVSFIFLARVPALNIKFSCILAMLIVLMYIGIGDNFSTFVTSVLVFDI
jgi:hypothetical protein